MQTKNNFNYFIISITFLLLIGSPSVLSQNNTAKEVKTSDVRFELISEIENLSDNVKILQKKLNSTNDPEEKKILKVKIKLMKEKIQLLKKQLENYKKNVEPISYYKINTNSKIL